MLLAVADLPPLAARLSTLALARGLHVTVEDGQRSIALSLSPRLVTAADRRAHQQLADDLLAAALNLARQALGEGDAELWGGLSDVERRLLAAAPPLQALAHARVDCFLAGGRAWALELNATIPAMQGYSDIAADSWIEVVGAAAGLSAASISVLQRRNGSNALALLAALQAEYRRRRDGEAEAIALLCRRGDAQLGELQYLAERWRQAGVAAAVIYPDQLQVGEWAQAAGRRWPLVYRHLFLHRLQQAPHAGLEHWLASPQACRSVILNPPAAALESKLLLARLSAALADRGRQHRLGIEPDAIERLRQALPWTRLLRPGASVDPDGQPIADLPAWIAAAPERFVIKQAAGYGGQAVFLGSERDSADFAARCRARFGRELDWPQLCQEATLSGGFVVQQRVELAAERVWLPGRSGTVAAVDWYCDYSCYCSAPAADHGWRGVCRGATTAVVNIVGGGGLRPVIDAEVAGCLPSLVAADIGTDADQGGRRPTAAVDRAPAG